MKTTLRILLFFTCAAFARGATFDLGVHGTLSVTVPETWIARGRDLGGKAFDLTFQPRSEANAQCKLTLIYAEKELTIDKERKEFKTMLSMVESLEIRRSDSKKQ